MMLGKDAISIHVDDAQMLLDRAAIRGHDDIKKLQENGVLKLIEDLRAAIRTINNEE